MERQNQAVPSRDRRGPLDGIPIRDFVGGSGGFRRPGYTLYLNPGIVVSAGRSTWSINVPVRVHQNFERSLADVALGSAGGDDLDKIPAAGRIFRALLMPVRRRENPPCLLHEHLVQWRDPSCQCVRRLATREVIPLEIRRSPGIQDSSLLASWLFASSLSLCREAQPTAWEKRNDFEVRRNLLWLRPDLPF